MAEYLMPNLENISVEDIFEIRNRMLPIAVNFPSKTIEKSCWCGKVEDTQHIYICRYWTDQSEKTPFELIYKENMPKLVKVYKQFEINYKRRQEYENEIKDEQRKNLHEIPQSDPLFSIVEYSNGNKH